MSTIPVRWPDGRLTQAQIGADWLQAAADAGIAIPTLSLIHI